MKHPSDSVLYFPFIEFQDDNWIKSSLLYWDRIYRIVPENYKPKDSKLVLDAKRRNLIQDITLENYDLETTRERFIEFLVKNEILPLNYSDYYLYHYCLDSEIYNKPIINSNFDDGSYSYIEYMKMTMPLTGYLQKIGYVYPCKNWLRFPKRLARYYMLYLTTVVSERRGGLAMSTDNIDNWVASSYFTENGNLDTYNNNAEGYYSSLLIDGFIPSDMSNVSLDSIEKFLYDNMEQKERFRTKVWEFSNLISECQDSRHATRLIELYRQEIENSKLDLRNSMDLIHNFRFSSYTCLMTGIAVAKSVLDYLTGSSAHYPFYYDNIGESIAIGAIGVYKDINEARKNRREKNFASYLIDIDKKFTNNRRFVVRWT